MYRISAAILSILLLWSAIGCADDSMMIVFPLENQSNEESLEWLAEGVAESISRQLRSPDLNIMDRAERIRITENLDLPPGIPLSRGSIIRIAQRAGADRVALGSYSGTEQSLKISVRILDVKSLRLGGEIAANGPLTALPQMENELAWLILTNTGLGKVTSRQVFQERLRKIPNKAYAYYIESLLASGEDNRLDLLWKAVQGYRGFPQAQFELGRIFFLKGNCGNAISHLLFVHGDPALQRDTDFMLGACYVEGNQLTQAIQLLTRLLQNNRRAATLNNLGVAHLRNNDPAQALNAFLEAKNLSRADATIALNLAIARHLMGNHEAAQAVLDEAVRSHPKDGMLHYLLAVVLEAQGLQDKAAQVQAKAKILGINIEKLKSEEAPKWARLILDPESR